MRDELVRRVWIENVQPSVEGGRFPVKRTVGETVVVTADIFVDGHDHLAAVARYRPNGGRRWLETPMRRLLNDRWEATFRIEPDRIRGYQFTVAAWIDAFSSWRSELSKKVAADQEVSSELLEGGRLVREAAARASGEDRAWLEARAAILDGGEREAAERIEGGLGADLAAVMARHPDRRQETAHPAVLEIDVARERARFGAWYEMFPRSATPDPSRSGTFEEAAQLLPEIAHLGFDVLYLPPIHPIGETHRKGPNNTWPAPAGSPGSPWAIGSRAGGHTAVHPELGTLKDFDRFRRAAEEAGLEIALDLAFQCSPDHPYAREHPDWFRQRPDGTIKYAENPPKKYQDIYPLDFECADWRNLWNELLRVTLFWCERGVRIFRVDNPHTKPLRFWEWMIREVKAKHPETIFLAEAFTWPKMMYALAKVGFDQSYTYFTWRNTARELRDYLTELTRPPVRDFFRPNFFTNTPDILPEYLQYGGRPAFEARLVLAATLGPSYGIHSGFEDCENEALPGTEDYAHSEKYEIRSRRHPGPQSIRPLIRRINEIRRQNPALHANDSLRFHATDNDQILFFSKHTADFANIILVAVNVDPHHTHDTWLEVPTNEFGVGPAESFQVHDLIGDGRYLWEGSRNYVRLDPQMNPAQIFRLRRRVRSERDFDYFM